MSYISPPFRSSSKTLQVIVSVGVAHLIEDFIGRCKVAAECALKGAFSSEELEGTFFVKGIYSKRCKHMFNQSILDLLSSPPQKKGRTRDPRTPKTTKKTNKRHTAAPSAGFPL